MGKKEKNAPKPIRAVLLRDGTELSVEREDGKYYHCAGRSIRKLNSNIISLIYDDPKAHEAEKQNEYIEGWDG